MRDVRARHPRLRDALVADAQVTARVSRRAPRVSRPRRHRAQRSCAWPGRAMRFFAQALYRAKARLQALGVPLLPRILPPAGDGLRPGADRRPGRDRARPLPAPRPGRDRRLHRDRARGNDRAVRHRRPAARATSVARDRGRRRRSAPGPRCSGEIAVGDGATDRRPTRSSSPMFRRARSRRACPHPLGSVALISLFRRNREPRRQSQRTTPRHCSPRSPRSPSATAPRAIPSSSAEILAAALPGRRPARRHRPRPRPVSRARLTPSFPRETARCLSSPPRS